MNDDPLEQGAPDRVAALRLDRNVADEIDEFLRETVEFAAIECAAFLPSYGCLVGITLSRRGLDERLEHVRQVERRPTNHLQHFSSGGLLLQRFPQLLQQAMVLDGDNRLFCEIAEQGDLLFGERTNLLPVDRECSNQEVVLQHRHNGNRSGARKV